MRNQIIEEDLAWICGQEVNWSALRNKTVLVSGANGALPAYMVESLLYLNESQPNLNVRVVAAVRTRARGEQRFIHYRGRHDLVLLTYDVNERLTYGGGVDVVIHAASQASPKYIRQDPVGTLKANTGGTLNLLEFARTAHASFFFFSSCAAYGFVDPGHMPITEDGFGPMDPLDPWSCYGESKRMGECMCISYARQYGLPIKIVRPFFVYGPGFALDDSRTFADLVADIVGNRDIVLHSDGSASRDYVYIADATVAFFKVLLEGVNGEAYNVGSGHETSILELATILVNLFPEKGLKVIRSAAHGASPDRRSLSRLVADPTKMLRLGWKPHFSATRGFRRMVLSFTEPLGNEVQ